MMKVTEQFLTKAVWAIAAAERELASGDVEFAVARAYYTI